MQHTIYLFDRFQLDVTRRQLVSQGGTVLSLNSRAMEALLLLVANAGQVIERRRLMEAVWPNTIVEDNNLNQCILAIRRALGEPAGANRYVMTVPGRGFCFVCPVRIRIQESIDDTGERPQLSPAATDATRVDPTDSAGHTWPRRAPPRAFWLGLVVGAGVAATVLLPLALH